VLLVRHLAEGLALGGYQFARFKARTEPERELRVVVVTGGGKRVSEALVEGAASARAVAFARDLVNRPGGDLGAEAFAHVAEEAATHHGFTAEVVDARHLAKQGFHGLVAVNRGSTRPARFVRLSYLPPSGTARGHLALVGKGITFDSGGLSIKTAAGMMTMKDDMAGAAAVLAAFTRFREAGVKAAVSGYLPLTDNMSGGDAVRPGDVITYANGKSVEVLNTDAEGRLVLADALIAASNDGVDAVLDLATLTGAVEVALGSKIAALMGNSEPWLTQVEAAAVQAGERTWRLPLPLDERPRLDSEVADLRNIGKGTGGGTIVAGLFLQEFVGEGVPWAHLDIAGTAWTEEVRGEQSRGGTGYGVRLLVELARRFHRPGLGSAANA
jgi:leucyl aminopeptidase